MGDGEADATMRNIARMLKPGGLFVLTVDLLLDVHPFTAASSNDIGTNKDIARLVAASGLDLVAGAREELYNYPEFDPDAVLAHLDDILVGEFRLPVAAQAFVLRKPAGEGR